MASASLARLPARGSFAPAVGTLVSSVPVQSLDVVSLFTGTLDYVVHVLPCPPSRLEDREWGGEKQVESGRNMKRLGI